MSTALLLVGHGSRDPEAAAETLQLGDLLADRRPGQATEVAFLEFARPTIQEAIERLVALGARQIVCQPLMLLAAEHVKRDIPNELELARRRWPGVTLAMGRELGVHSKLLELCQIRWTETLSRQAACPTNGTLLLVAGRGSSDRDANAETEALARLLQERTGVSRAAACYCGVATPQVPEALEVAAGSGMRRIVVLPYLLFTGVLVKMIHAWTLDARGRHPGLEVFSASHLGVHRLLIEVVEERAYEAMHRLQNMECRLRTNQVALGDRAESMRC